MSKSINSSNIYNAVFTCFCNINECARIHVDLWINRSGFCIDTRMSTVTPKKTLSPLVGNLDGIKCQRWSLITTDVICAVWRSSTEKLFDKVIALQRQVLTAQHNVVIPFFIKLKRAEVSGRLPSSISIRKTSCSV